MFEEGGRVEHAAVRIGDSILEMGEAPGGTEPMASRFFLSVDDCDASYGRAVAAGAVLIEPPADKPYGRVAIVLDPFGCEWITASP